MGQALSLLCLVFTAARGSQHFPCVVCAGFRRPRGSCSRYCARDASGYARIWRLRAAHVLARCGRTSYERQSCHGWGRHRCNLDHHDVHCATTAPLPCGLVLGLYVRHSRHAAARSCPALRPLQPPILTTGRGATASGVATQWRFSCRGSPFPETRRRVLSSLDGRSYRKRCEP